MSIHAKMALIRYTALGLAVALALVGVAELSRLLLGVFLGNFLTYAVIVSDLEG